MPQTKSAAKRLRQSNKRRKRNRAVQSRLKTGIRAFLEHIDQGEKETAQTALKEVYSLIDQALMKGVVTKNYASRQKSRLAIKFNSLSSKK